MSNSNAKKTWTIDDMINLGEYTNFIRLCAHEDLTLRELADMYGVSPRTIGRWKQRWATEIETYQTIRKIEDKYDSGVVLKQEERKFYNEHKYLSTRKLNLKDDDTLLSEIAVDLKDWFIGDILERFKQDSVNYVTSDFKTYAEDAFSEIKSFVGMDDIKLELNEPVCDKATVSFRFYGNQPEKLFEFSNDDLLTLELSDDDTDIETLDVEDLDDGETLTQEERNFYMDLNNDEDDTVLSELADELKDWLVDLKDRFIGNVLEQCEQDGVFSDTLDFKTYAVAAIDEIKRLTGEENLKLEVDEYDKATVSISLYNNQSVELFDFSKDELIALSGVDTDTEYLDTEDDVGEYHNFFHHNLSTDESVITDDDDDIYKDTSIFFYTYTLTKNSLSIDQYSAEDGLLTNHCDKSNPIYQEFISNVIQEELSEEQEQEFLAVYWMAMKPAIGLETFTQGRIKVDVTSRQVTFIDDDGQEHVVANRLTDKIVQTYLDNEPAEHLIKFLDNLMNNVSKRTIDNLYSFLAFNDIKITDDGCFTAWKVINSDYTDCYTGTIDNSPGQIVTMPRNQVDDNPEVTCSTGLHVCAAHYIPNFGGYNSRIVKVKVNPKDVISVPVDYEFAKMRTCRYEVLEEIVDFAN